MRRTAERDNGDTVFGDTTFEEEQQSGMFLPSFLCSFLSSFLPFFLPCFLPSFSPSPCPRSFVHYLLHSFFNLRSGGLRGIGAGKERETGGFFFSPHPFPSPSLTHKSPPKTAATQATPSFICSFICSFAHLFVIFWFVCSFVCSFFRFFVCSFLFSFVRSFDRSLIYSCLIVLFR